MELSFSVEGWDAWIPGVRSREQWQEYLSNSDLDSAEGKAGDIEFLHLTPRNRRRLSSLTKATLEVALGAMGDHPAMPAVFASRRGEVGRMSSLLQDICQGEDASPMAFSFSVHNTSSGVFSIQTGNQQPSTALAGGHDTLASSLIDVCARLACGEQRVLLVISEETLPEVYRAFSSQDEQPVAAAFVLSRPSDAASVSNICQLSLVPAIVPGTRDEAYPCTASQITTLMNRLVCGEAGSIQGERYQCLIPAP